MNVSFYTFSKRINSTAQPTGGASYSCTLKSPSSVTRPSISLVWPGSGNPSAYNYAYIPYYGRYYWVSNWTYGDRQWTADMTVDVLASYKTQIGAASKYVLRSASDKNTNVIDSMWPAKAGYVMNETSAGSSLGWANYGNDSDGKGCFVVTVVGAGNGGATNSGVSQYMMTGSSVQILLENMLNTIDGAWTSLTANDIFEAVKNILLMPFRFTTDLSQYVRNIMWFPFKFPAGATSNVYLGLYQCQTLQPEVGSPVYADQGSISLSGIPPAGYDPWEFMAPFASFSFELEPFGVIPLDSSDIIGASLLKYAVKVDSMSGLGLLQLYADDRIITTRTAQIGVAVPFGGTSPNYAGAITAAASLAGAFSDSDMSGERMIASIGSAVMAASPSGFVGGTSGGGAALIGVPTLHKRVMAHVDTDPVEAGYPLCLVKTINTLSGFVKCRDGDIDAPATSDELAQIESYLTGGFFYE